MKSWLRMLVDDVMLFFSYVPLDYHEKQMCTLEKHAYETNELSYQKGIKIGAQKAFNVLGTIVEKMDKGELPNP